MAKKSGSVGVRGFRKGKFVLVGVLLAASVGHVSAQTIKTQCKSFMDSPPAWLFSGEWANDGAGLVLSDSLYSKVYIYSLAGEMLHDLTELKAGPIQVARPSWIRQAGDGAYLVEDEDGKLVQLDSQYKATKVFADLLDTTDANGNRIGSVWNWQASASKSRILAFGDLQDRSGNWFSGLMLIPANSPKNFKILHRMEIADPARNFYLMGNSYTAAVGENLYFLLMKDRPEIVEILGSDSSVSRVTELPSSLGKRPQLPEKRGVASASAMFAALEKAILPVGLYSWDNSLFVLSRKPVGNENTVWTLTKLNADLKASFSRALPTSSNHLVLIPGSGSWAFIEKGPVRGLGEQKVISICTMSPSDF